MDFRRIFQEDELRNEVPWNNNNNIPVTPSKPIPTRPKPIDRQGNQQQGLPNWFESVSFPAEFYQETPQTSNGVTASQNPMLLVDQNRRVSNWEEDFSAKPSGGYSELLNSYGQSTGLNNMGYTDLLAMAGLTSQASGSVTQMGSYNGAAMSSFSLPISHSQIDKGLQNSNSNGMHLLDQNFAMDSNLWNNSNYSQHIPQYGFPVPYPPTYDLNSPSTTLANMVSNGSISSHLAPLTPDQRKRAQENQMSEIGNVCLEERSYLEKNKQQNAVDQVRNNGVELQCEESFLQSVVESSLAAASTPFIENHVLDEAGGNGIDLNKTPQQKPKRRKIRPKVVVEGKKPKKTPKSTDKKNSNVENPSVKRKYVRKNGIKPSNAPLVDVVEEVTDDQVAVKSCKQTLDFNLEEDARDECHGITQDQQEGLLRSIVDSSSRRSTFNSDSDTPAQDICAGIKGSSRTQSSMQFAQALEVVENSPTGIPFDLNCSLTQILDDCMAMPKKTAPSTPPLTRKEPPREDLDVLASNRYNMGSAGPCQNSGEKYCPPKLQNFHPNETSCAVFQTRNTNGNPPRENLNVLASSNIYNMGIAGSCQNSGEKGWPHRLQVLHQNETSCTVFQASNTHGNHEIAVPYIFQSRTRPVSQNNSNCNSHVRLAEGEQARGSKRGYCHTINEAHVNSMNLIGSSYNSLQVYQQMLERNQYQRNNCSVDLQVPETYKKKRTESNTTTVNSSASYAMPSVLHGAREAMGCRHNDDNTIPLTSQTNNRGMIPQYGYTNVIKNHRNGGSGNIVPNGYSQAMANLHNWQVQTKAELSAHKDKLSRETIDKLQASNLALKSGQTYKGNERPTQTSDLTTLTATVDCNPNTPAKMIKTRVDRQGSKNFPGPQNYTEVRPTQTSDLTTLTATVDCNPNTPAKMIKTRVDRQGSKNFSGPQNYTEVLVVKKQTKKVGRKRGNTGLTRVNSVAYNTENNEQLHRQEATVYNCHSNVKSRGPLQLAWLLHDPIDEIVRRLNRLNINDGSNITSIPEQNALIPYGGDGQMVPYEGQFDPIKKRRPRPKVDLDPETDRVWKLLMGPDASNGVEGTNEDKENWWEEERRVFRGRAESFIARMHLIQGDRRFTKWKGSVLDSVIGVFLTQNVSDHLSSSAFISLAARFPLKSTSSSEAHYKEKTDKLVKEPDVCIIESDDTIIWQETMSSRQVCDQSSFSLQEADHVEERGTGNSNESFGSNAGGGSIVDISKENQRDISRSGKSCHGSLENIIEVLTADIGCGSPLEAGDKRALEDVISSQNSVVSSPNSVDSSILQRVERNTTPRRESVSLLEDNGRRVLEDGVSSQNSVDSSMLSTDERIRPCSETDLTTMFMSNSFSNSTSFTELLQMAGTATLRGYCGPCGYESPARNLSSKSGNNQPEGIESAQTSFDRIDGQIESYSSYSSNLHLPHKQCPIIPSSNYSLHITPNSGALEVRTEVLETESRLSLSAIASEMTEIKDVGCMTKGINPMAESVTPQCKSSPNVKAAPTTERYTSSSNHSVHPLMRSSKKFSLEKLQDSCRNFQGVQDKTLQHGSTPITEPQNLVDPLAERSNRMQQAYSSSTNFSRETLHAAGSSTLVENLKSIDDTIIQPDSREKMHSSDKAPSGTTVNVSKSKGRIEKEKKKAFDWDSLRKEVNQKGLKREESKNTMDSLDWEAVRCADVGEIAKAIKERGMNNMLAERIKDLLNRLVKEHGSINLEWLRDVPPDKAKEYLLSVRGLGLKSVECVRLLTLHHLAFPVDTNVGRIAVRLGWVPLQPLPESLQLHLLEMYPMLESIQKYLWPRLCTLDQPTLYELHYQLITFGKVFCTKSKPNCNACPMRAECKHFASAFASARLALPGPEEKGIVTSFSPIPDNQSPVMGTKTLPVPLLEAGPLSESRFRKNECEPIVEEPATPEEECIEIAESDIEDAFYECPNEIPSIDVNFEEFTLNLQNYMQENNMELQEGEVSKALVAITPQAASIPIPKLKNVNRLRTEHRVYELPDSHPLLEGVPRRDPDDHVSYLLAIWTPGETAESIQPPERCCDSQALGNLCNEKTCFSCNSTREANSQTVRGTLLIPCKTAMRGSFPLNGTYFQVNEVFADHASSLNPIDVPRAWIWNLPRRTVLFGTSIPTIFKGQSTQEIQNCFWKGYVCVRGFDQKLRTPRPLMARLHFPASKLAKNKTDTYKEE